MADPVKITLSAHHKGNKPGDSIEADPVEARRLISAGIAIPATKPGARKLGESTAATAQD